LLNVEALAKENWGKDKNTGWDIITQGLYKDERGAWVRKTITKTINLGFYEYTETYECSQYVCHDGGNENCSETSCT